MLSCGHEPSPHSPSTTGTCHLPDGREVCNLCGDKWEREQLKSPTTLKWFGYLSSDKKQIINWTGTKLATVFRITSNPTNFGGRLYRIRAVDANGTEWYCTGPGESMYVRMTRCKTKSRH